MARDIIRMDKIKKYEGIILELLKEYAAIQPANMAEYENQIIADAERHHYQSVSVGWNKKGHYIYVINFHFDIKATGKIWLMANNTAVGVFQEYSFTKFSKGLKPLENLYIGNQLVMLKQSLHSAFFPIPKPSA